MKLELIYEDETWILRVTLPPTERYQESNFRKFALRRPSVWGEFGHQIETTREGRNIILTMPYAGPWYQTEILNHAIAVGEAMGIEVDMV